MDYLSVHSYSSKTEKQKDSHVDVKILVLGDKGVGKSALIVRYLTKRFIGDYDNTYDARYLSTANLNNNMSQIEIYDPRDKTLDSDEIKDSRILWAHAIVLVYSVTDENSFDEIQKLCLKIRKIRSRDNVPIVIIANKIDLYRNRKISKQEGIRMSARLGCTYYETSAAVLSEGYIQLCDAIRDIGESVTRARTKRRGSDSVISRKRSISPRPLRNALVRMFGRQNARTL